MALWAITRWPGAHANKAIMSSNILTAKQPCSGSVDMLSNGSTATAARSPCVVRVAQVDHQCLPTLVNAVLYRLRDRDLVRSRHLLQAGGVFDRIATGVAARTEANSINV